MHEVTFRPYTQDLQVLFEVLENNKYNIPDDFDDNPVIDIGAHVGAFALCCLHKGARRVVCYEPNPDNFDLLEHNVLPWTHHITLHEEAILAKNGIGGLTTISLDRTASCHMLGTNGAQVNATGIGDLLMRWPVVKLLKISVNGSEKEILDARADWSGVQTIVGEVFFQMAGQHGTKPTEQWLMKRLYDIGFKKNGLVHDRRCPTAKAAFFGRRK